MSVVLMERRGLFFLDAQQLVPGVRAMVLRLPPPDSLRFLVAAVLTKYTFDVLSIFNVVELYLHPMLFGPERLSP